MARYIVLRIEENDKAERLLQKFEDVDAIVVAGVFVSPTKFCPGKQVCGEDRKLIRSRKWGTLHCRVCKLPVSTLPHQPRNLLHDPDLHPRFNDGPTLSVWEPFGFPVDKYGVEAIERKKQQVAQASERINRRKRRKARHGG